MQNSRVKMRKIKNLFNNIINSIRFKIESFSFSKIIILMWLVIGYTSIFMKWINSQDESLSSNAFNDVTSVSAYIIVILLFVILFLLFSFNKKEKIKKTTNIIFRDYVIILFISIIIFILAINNLGVLIWLKMFSSEISYWSWIITLIISSIFIFIWGILLKNENHGPSNICLNDSKENLAENSIKNNTKLPF